jgi:hypothetical protein
MSLITDSRKKKETIMSYQNPMFQIFQVSLKVAEKFAIELPIHVRKEGEDFVARYRSIPPYGKGETAKQAVEMLVIRHLPKFLRFETAKLVEKFIDQKRDLGPDEAYELALKTVLARFNFDNSFTCKVTKIVAMNEVSSDTEE